MAQHTSLHMTSSHMQDVYHTFTSSAYMFYFAIERFKLMVLSREFQIATIKVYARGVVNLHTIQALRTSYEQKG
jgi:hypothetical protein